MTLTIVAPSPATVKDPSCWDKSSKELREKAVKNRDQVVLTCDLASPLNSAKFQARLVCCVRTLPRLNDVKNALRRLNTFRERSCSSVRYADDPISPNRYYDGETHVHRVPRPTIWKVDGSVDSRITVIDALSGVELMRILEPKKDVMVASLLHAPFHGLINRQLEVIPIEHSQDILSVREASLINTDYVWVGFVDGSIRLFPTDYRRVREQDRSVLLARGELADLVYELPKQHKAAVIAITRSPCHDDGGATDLVTANRLSSAIRELTAATSRGGLEDREHLSLVCTASEDSCVVVWDLKKIYRCLEEMRVSSQSAGITRFGVDAPSLSFGGDVVTFDVTPTTDHPGCTVRSTYTLVKVRPLFRLKGGVGGLRTLNWVTSAVTTLGYQKSRDVVTMTRDPKEATAPQFLRDRRAVQQMTRWERREEHRVMLQLSERNMREVEEELEQLMPPLAPESPQRKRVNLIIAGDVHGTLHFWDLDEELEKSVGDMASVASNSPTLSVPRDSRTGRSQVSIHDHSVSPRRRYAKESPVVSVRSSMERRGSEGNAVSRQLRASPRIYATCETKEKTRTRRSGRDLVDKEIPSLCASSATPSDAKRSGKGRNIAAEKNFKTPHKSVTKSPSVTKHDTQSVRRSSLHEVRSSFALPKSFALLSKQKEDSNVTLLPVATCRGSCPVEGMRRSGKYLVTSPQAKQPLSQTMKKTLCGSLTQPVSGRRTLQRVENSTPAASKSSRRRGSKVLEPGTGVTKPKKRVGDREIMTPCARRSFQGDLSMEEANKSALKVKRTLPEIESPLTLPWNSGRASVTSSYLTSGRCSPTGRQFPTDATHTTCSVKGATPNRLISGHRYLNDMYSRKAKCHMDLIEGGTVTGIAVDLPPIITVTMRCLPDPPEPHYSLLEQPTEEEIRSRELANSFCPLTNERALFCVFERMQFYVSVERALVNIQCVPKMRANVLDYRVFTKPLLENRLIEEPTPFNFDIVFRRHVLELHPQPIVRLFIDHVRHQLWVARNHGLLTVFSTETKSIVTRVADPAAEIALGPPNVIEWKRVQREMALLEQHPIYAEMHKESRKNRPGHFTGFWPVSLLQKFELVRISLLHELESGSDLSIGAPESMKAQITFIDGNCALDTHARAREFSLSLLLEKLRVCRQNALIVRRAQKDSYNLLFNAVAERIGSLIGRCATFSVLHAARKIFWAWAHHRDYYPRHYVLRQLRLRRRLQLLQLKDAMSLNFDTRLRSVYFTKWHVLARERRGYQQELRLAKVLGARVDTPMREKFANFMGEHTQRRRYWLLWKSALASRVRPHAFPSLRQSVIPVNSMSIRHISLPTLLQSSRPNPVSRPRGPEREGVFCDVYAILSQVYGLRHTLISFRWDEAAESVLDVEDSWFDAVEAATEEAEEQTAHELKLAVFKFACIPFMESLLSTAQEVLPCIREAPVTKKVRSLIRGCLLCIDFLYADAGDLAFLAEAREEGIASSGSLFSQEERAPSVAQVKMGREQELRQLFDDAMECREFQTALEAVAAHRTVIEEFLRAFSDQ
ncbi:hypothetical protein TraAM80_05868 [Trypanosoma rangeli]|uniref:Uncharacterized protein n=1 Tax=Trypanosoma rangeli TaxID=5698 RepID=A0A3R7NAJ5_TRYRA|nr:uncharacterized protein TraAM80_05868 [Trypanosoma rangeli]RNF03264.1 hypothetical protein TraAM80_05868 [Trypanosoma rangeli]|eukprot:RNF03264.1 hypothetical protein TraAM80_05868 [Trypanosoma rangeli]